jgi:hypothetical protein
MNIGALATVRAQGGGEGEGGGSTYASNAYRAAVVV